jgi:hypothetical protein
MINKIIKFLGGFTLLEHSLLNKEYESQREFNVQNRARVEFLEQRLSEAETERKFLQDLIFKKFGVLPSIETGEAQQENLQPLSNGAQSWSNLRTRMERDDRERVKMNA